MLQFETVFVSYLEHVYSVGPAQDGEPLDFVEGLQGAAGEVKNIASALLFVKVSRHVLRFAMEKGTV